MHEALLWFFLPFLEGYSFLSLVSSPPGGYQFEDASKAFTYSKRDRKIYFYPKKIATNKVNIPLNNYNQQKKNVCPSTSKKSKNGVSLICPKKLENVKTTASVVS